MTDVVRNKGTPSGWDTIPGLMSAEWGVSSPSLTNTNWEGLHDDTRNIIKGKKPRVKNMNNRTSSDYSRNASIANALVLTTPVVRDNYRCDKRQFLKIINHNNARWERGEGS